MTTQSTQQESLQELQKQAQATISEYLNNSQIEAIDQNAIAQNCPMENGKARPSNIIGFAGAGADDVAKKLEPLYQHFRERNFEVLIEKGLNGEANEYFFGVLLPRQYQGNSDPLTMTQEQVADAQRFTSMDNGRSSNMHTESVGKNAKTLPSSHQEKKADWLEKILGKGPNDSSRGFVAKLNISPPQNQR